MGVLRSLSGLQMYRRAVRRPIEGPAVVRFLLEHDHFRELCVLCCGKSAERSGSCPIRACC